MFPDIFFFSKKRTILPDETVPESVLDMLSQECKNFVSEVPIPICSHSKYVEISLFPKFFITVTGTVLRCLVCTQNLPRN